MSGDATRTRLDREMEAHYLRQYRDHGNGGICPIHGVARCREWVDAHTALVQEGVTPGDQPNAAGGRPNGVTR